MVETGILECHIETAEVWRIIIKNQSEGVMFQIHPIDPNRTFPKL